MRFLKIELLILCALCLVSCTNSAKQTGSAEPVTEKTKGDNIAPVKIMTEATLDLTRYGISNNPSNVLGGLKVGDKAPDFVLMNQDGKEVSLEGTLYKGPVLLVFMRAEWCGYCTKHLQEFQDHIQDLHAAGFMKVLAISPQESTFTQKVHREKLLSFPILYDKDHSVMKDYKVFFHVTDEYNQKIKEYKGNTIEVMNRDAEPVLPVPATYLIGQDKVIKYVHYDPDYSKRANVKEAIAHF